MQTDSPTLVNPPVPDDFPPIERLRVELDFTQYAVCVRAGVHATTYYRLTTKQHTPTGRTRRRLWKALHELKAEREASEGVANAAG